MLRQPELIDCGDYLVAQGRNLVEGSISTQPLFTDESLRDTIHELRAMLEKDGHAWKNLESPEATRIHEFAGVWFQRLDFPALGLSTVMDRRWPWFDEGGVNTLGRRLTSEEACLLRPWPKWMYIRPLLPDLAGKSILEVGSSNGFFPFQFAGLGAAQVTGLEIRKRRYESSVLARELLGLERVDLRHTDFLVDFTIPAHDVVFASEVVNHLLCPMWGLARMATLAKECLIVDTGVFETQYHGMDLSTGWTKGESLPRFLSYQISDGLFRSFFDAIGIRPADIEVFVEPNAMHYLYRIDTRQMHQRLAAGDINECLLPSLTMQFRFPSV
ncbi:MAG: DUF1698 domain-containing protein [Acidobacteria bacterium]|nr:DUF1698 domain-containing protein [Acidobacteriota bacterium]